MLGREVVAHLHRQKFTAVLTPLRSVLDLTDVAAVNEYFLRHKPRCVFHLAAVVYGLLGNMKNQLNALAANTLINHNVLSACAAARVDKIVFAGTVAAYPYPYPALPLTEDMLWAGRPHQGEYGYAASKRHAIAHLEVLKTDLGIDYSAALLTNLYGPFDKFDDRSGHIVPSLMKKMHAAKATGGPLRVWGNPTTTRDFLHAEDAARALVLCLDEVTGPVNVCSGVTVRVADVVDALATAAGFNGQIVWESDKPVGIPERSVSDRILRPLGFRPVWDLRAGIRMTWDWFKKNYSSARIGGEAA